VGGGGGERREEEEGSKVYKSMLISNLRLKPTL
jgi:hypothetical protein